MSEEQLTIEMFTCITQSSGNTCLEADSVSCSIPPNSDSLSRPPSFSIIGTKVYGGGVLVGMVSSVHDKILRSCDSLSSRGFIKFNLLDLVIEMESLFPDDKYLETTIAARLRELCQWKLVQREDEKSRKGIYIYHGMRGDPANDNS